MRNCGTYGFNGAALLRGRTDRDQAAGFLAGAAVAGFDDEGLDDEDGFAVALKPVVAEPPQHEAKDARGQVGDGP